MGRLVCVEDALLGYVRVNLSRGKAPMSQELLYTPKVGSAIKEVCREAVPECVGAGLTGGDADTIQVFIEQSPDAP